MLKRDIVIKTKFALIDVLGAIVVSLSMPLGDLLSVGLPTGHPGVYRGSRWLWQPHQKKSRRLCGFDYLAKVVTGIKFREGVEVTKVDQAAA